jgi:hypothetical protein
VGTLEPDKEFDALLVDGGCGETYDLFPGTPLMEQVGRQLTIHRYGPSGRRRLKGTQGTQPPCLVLLESNKMLATTHREDRLVFCRWRSFCAAAMTAISCKYGCRAAPSRRPALRPHDRAEPSALSHSEELTGVRIAYCSLIVLS